MGRRPYTPEEKELAKIKARVLNDLWKVNNKERFDEYHKSYYLQNKEHMHEIQIKRRQKLKDEKKNLILASQIN